MSDVRRKYEALRDENERLARIAECEMSNPALSFEEQRAATDRAKVYWQLSRHAADKVAHAADKYPENFTAPNRGKQGKTLERIQFLRAVKKDYPNDTREAIASLSVERHWATVQKLWPDKTKKRMPEIISNFLKNQRI